MICTLRVALNATFAFEAAASSETTRPKSSGLYMTATAYKERDLSFPGKCGSGSHNLELNNILNRSYIHVTHESEKRRFEKANLFGFRACNGKAIDLIRTLSARFSKQKD